MPEVLRDVGATDEYDADIYMVGVRESTDPEARSLVFQEGYDDEDSYCLVIDPGQATFYGGVIECTVSDDQLHLLLSESAAEELGTPTELRFSLMLPPDQLQLLRRGLTRVLTSGHPEDVPRRLDV
ncbi:Immunity protein 10 [Micromonospora rhizosphaerae]|uniref:Immunity protein 10 n=1 Tax=Micromonospora rhizosphaerae TaxID=568872 RepID=A0A1C6SCH5_9ACTN|nr:Imm10 family immunity protein [Micromonospora rhizosphaerae]SCL27167.1 Immunity protein 10 [Micromonospora rhizosphaerae]